MRKIVLRPILLVVLFVAVLVSLAVKSYGAERVQATVTEISDGDTFVVRADRMSILNVRLYGIDAPELSQPHGLEAKAFLSKLVESKTISLEILDVNRYGQSVALAYLENERSLQEQLIEAGFAWVYPKYCMIPLCRYWKKVELEAHDSREGIWQANSPVQPWQWRESQKK